MAEIKEVLYQRIKGTSLTAISKSLAMSRTTVRGYMKLAQQHGYNNHLTDIQLDQVAIKVQKALYENKGRSKLSFESIKPLHLQIKSWLLENNITHTQINRKLQEEGIKVSDRTLNRYIKENFPQLPKATIHIETVAGDEAQVDYGYVGLMKDMDGRDRKVYAFVMTLSHSRYRYVEFVFSQDQVSWAQSHINAFQFFGAVPKRILLDNLKAGVIKADIYDPTINQTYQELSRFYGFVADPAKSRTPEHKGKVEKSVHIVKQQLIAACHYMHINQANDTALNWCRNEISHRICSTTGEKPVTLFEQEDRPNMINMPTGTFDMPIWTTGKVHNDHHLVIHGNFYSVPTKYIGKDMGIRIGLKSIQFYAAHELIKTHLRNKGKGQWITDQNDYHQSAKHYLELLPSRCIEKAAEIGIAAVEMVEKVLADGSRKSLRKAQAILRLVEKYSADRLEASCLRAVAYDNYEYKSLVKILEKNLDSKDTASFSTKAIDPNITSYLRPSNTYSSSMEVNL